MRWFLQAGYADIICKTMRRRISRNQRRPFPNYLSKRFTYYIRHTVKLTGGSMERIILM
jgi:hypothetical protein